MVEKARSKASVRASALAVAPRTLGFGTSVPDSVADKADAGLRSSDEMRARPRATRTDAPASVRRDGTAGLLLACLALPLAALFSTPAQAQQFTTGSGNYTLALVVAHLRSAGSQAVVKVSIHTSTSDNKPNSGLNVLTNPATIAALSDNAFEVEGRRRESVVDDLAPEHRIGLGDRAGWRRARQQGALPG